MTLFSDFDSNFNIVTLINDCYNLKSVFKLIGLDNGWKDFSGNIERIKNKLPCVDSQQQKTNFILNYILKEKEKNIHNTHDSIYNALLWTLYALEFIELVFKLDNVENVETHIKTCYENTIGKHHNIIIRKFVKLIKILPDKETMLKVDISTTNLNKCNNFIRKVLSP